MLKLIKVFKKEHFLYLDQVSLPLKGNYNPSNYRIYFGDTGVLIGLLEKEAQDDLRKNQNFNTYKGAIYENKIADILVKQRLKQMIIQQFH